MEKKGRSDIFVQNIFNRRDQHMVVSYRSTIYRVHWSIGYCSDHQASLQCKKSLQGFVAGTIVLGKTRINAISMA